MLLGSTSAASKVWIAPDYSLGFHHFDYVRDQYDGLPHTHGEYCMVLCLSGCVQVLRGFSVEVISPGELLVVNPGELHQCQFGVENPRSQGFTLIVDRRLARDVFTDMSLPGSISGAFPRITGKIQDTGITALAHQLIEECARQQRGFGIVIDALLRQMLVRVFRHWPREAISPLRVRLAPQLRWVHMHKAMEFMNAHGKGAFRLSDLCSDVGISHSRFNPLFKNSAGTNPHSFYNQLLVFKARRLLQDEQCPLKEIAYTLGFKNASHFCALFHKLTGSSPRSDMPASEPHPVPRLVS